MSDKPLTNEEMVMFGKMCGCGECRFCLEYEQEKVWKRMVKEVKNGKRSAEQAREHIKEGWLYK